MPSNLTIRVEETQQCLNFLVRRTSRILARHYDAALKPVGLRSTQFNILAVLAQTGEIPISKLAALVVLERSALARNLKPLERDRYVSVVIGEDRRARIAVLTKRGSAKLRSALPRWSKAQERLLEHLGAVATSDLIASLKRLIEKRNVTK